MLTIKYENQFRKDYKVIVKRGYDTSLFEKVLEILIAEKELPPKYKDHPLKGKYKDFRECHITPDWFLVYQIKQKELILCLARTGSHSDLF